METVKVYLTLTSYEVDMGGSKSNTGVKIIDDSVDTVVNRVTNPAARNIERNAQNVAKGWALAARGDFDNFGRTLLDTGGMFMGGGAFVNPDDVTRMTGMQTAGERKEDMATDAARAEAEADKAARKELALSGVRETISGQIGARMRAPGRAQTLLTGGGRANTLLTMVGG